MTCDHRLFDDPSGPLCNRTDVHTTHTFAASSGADLSDEREDES